jgi:hypothetical protein
VVGSANTNSSSSLYAFSKSYSNHVLAMPLHRHTASCRVTKTQQSINIETYVVDNNPVVNARLGILQLHLGLLQALLNRILRLGTATAQTFLQLLLGRRGNEDETSGELGGLDLLDALDLDVEDGGLALGALLLDGGLGGAVEVVAELGALDKAVLGLELEELLLSHEVVVDAVLLARARLAGGVGDGEGEGVGMPLEEEVVESALADARGARNDNWTRIGDWERVEG